MDVNLLSFVSRKDRMSTDLLTKLVNFCDEIIVALKTIEYGSQASDWTYRRHKAQVEECKIMMAHRELIR